MEMKMDLTMMRFIPTMANKMPSTGEPVLLVERVLPKISSSEEIQ